MYKTFFFNGRDIFDPYTKSSWGTSVLDLVHKGV